MVLSEKLIRVAVILGTTPEELSAMVRTSSHTLSQLMEVDDTCGAISTHVSATRTARYVCRKPYHSDYQHHWEPADEYGHDREWAWVREGSSDSIPCIVPRDGCSD